MDFRGFASFVVVIHALLLSENCLSQNSLELEAELFSHATDAEKIYLQLSGTTFNTSETIWFKAIVTDVLDHKPTTKSGVLHVELIDPLDNRVVDKSLLKLHKGISSGFFQMHSSYREGNYIIRAYTEWNKNFDQDFTYSVPISLFRIQEMDKKPNPIRNMVFTKDPASNEFLVSASIWVKDLDSLHYDDAMLLINWNGGKDSIALEYKKKEAAIKVRHKIPLEVPMVNYQLKTNNEVFTKSVVLDQEYGALRFFPEGGALVEGMQSVVGFKYLDYKGRGAEIVGTIEDQNQVVIGQFRSNALGMGSVVLTPKLGQTYFGVLKTKSGNTFKYELPKAKRDGLILSLIQRGRNKALRIWNKERNKDSLFVKFYHRGKNLFFLKACFKNGMFSFKIQPNDLPQGVIGLTVFDKNLSPVAERHFFNYLKQETLDIELKTDDERYIARDSVQVSISTKYNGQAIPASISVMAVDSSYFNGTNLKRNDIVSYFLLQSDIKGTVENPSYYFEDEAKLAELDFLMLTQGWTNYKYKEKKRAKSFGAETGLEIRGIVSELDNQNKSQHELSVLLMGKPIEAYSIDTDDRGNFKLSLKDSYGLGRKFVIQPTAASNKRGNLKVEIKRYEVPDISYNINKIITPVDSIVEKTMIQKIATDIRIDPFLLPNTIALEGVEVSDYSVTPERAEMVELHGIPDVVIASEELIKKRKKWTRGLYRWLLYNYPRDIKVTRVSNGTSFEIAYVYGAEWTYVVIDGIPVHERDYGLIGSIPVSAVKSAEIIRNTSTANTYHTQVFDCAPICPPPAFPAILAIYTFSGEGLSGAFPKTKITGLINDTAPQFSPIREFYAPEYHSENMDWSVPDRRTLLYWNPNIITDKNGRAVTTFFNSDVLGKMVLICEGITHNGKVGYSEVFYEVDDP
ncbi:hypothetical protein ABV409_07175 [Flagellimonas sp. DF-77]|uniref:hypothetical protein n=1 Tax=Flagellimonas algarum TaxID=3230298 RepID=UPI0033988107